VIVVDCSALLELLLRTHRGQLVENRLFQAGETIHVPHLIDVETTQVLRRFVLREDLGEDRARQALEDLADMPLNRYPHDFLLPRIWELKSNLTAYDATYVSLSELLQAPLITCDERLSNAPGHRAKIERIS
jgi:predicted nucleic acid-binding protein